MAFQDLIYQNNVYLNPVIQKIGCFFRSACRLAEIKTGENLTAYQLNDLWEEAKRKRYIGTLRGEPNCVLKSAPIANLALKKLGEENGYFLEVATDTGKGPVYYSSIKNRYCTDFIQKINQGGPSKTHFRVVAEDKSLIFDPYYPGIKSLGEIYTICYQYIKGE